ncbi:MAG: S-methyl-5-thioribose-1-phosphate isomerase [Candidatus Omnitrophica bacterium]|nr:S-methyl-5-thioribose-1-phosphate isomerase [Candidatus Omnitrophota bacterium]MCF7894029.1 S-methyl-5-thioribose-1-phosphate isomerase [Candidatus Omnitrophota bacterium]
MSKLKFSPLFWPIKLKKDYILVLDETKLPKKTSYLKVKNYRQAVSLIKNMKTRAIGQVLLVLYTFLIVYRRYKGKKVLNSKITQVAKGFNSARPTLSFKYLTDMVLAQQAAGLSLDKKILEFLETLKEKRIYQAKETSKLIKAGDTILTHCNLSGLIPLVGSFCRSQDKTISFFVTETRPYLQGVRLTAWELSREGFDTTVICDNMVAQVMAEGKINKIVVGADNLAKNGDIANKIGTYQIALLARYFKLPFYVVCPPESRAKEGKDIKIEVRPDKELFKIGAETVAPLGIKGYYPAFDITPNSLITKHIYMGV